MRAGLASSTGDPLGTISGASATWMGWRDRRLTASSLCAILDQDHYLPGEAGVRSEVNVVVLDRDILVTPADYQAELLVV